MARDLSYIVERCYKDYNNTYCDLSTDNADNKYANLVIPMDKDVFEVPVFALQAFNNDVLREHPRSIDAIVVNLHYTGYRSSYKSLDAAIRNTLNAVLTNAHNIVRLPHDFNEPVYYCLGGSIFDKDYNPIMMMTWVIEKDYSDGEEGMLRYKFVRPQLRIAPETFIYRASAVERYIVNKIAPKALQLRYGVDSPYMGSNFNQQGICGDVKLIVEKMPFALRSADVPSVSTTNEELVRVALDNIEELMP